MLREIKHPHLNPRLVGYAALTTVTPGVTIGFGSSDFGAPGALTRAAAGELAVTFRKKYQQAPIQCVGVGSGALGTFAVNKQIPTVTGSSAQQRVAAGTANTIEAQLYALSIGWDAANKNLNVRQRLMGTRRKTRLFGFKVDTSGSGTILIGSNQFKSIVRNGTGDVTLTLRRPFQIAPVVVPTALNGANAVRAPKVAAVTVSTIQIQVGDGTGTAQDGIFDCFVYGTDYPVDNAPLFRNVVQGCQRRERFHAGRITVSGAAITGTIGDFTCVRNGAGDFTFTIPTVRPLQDFKREPLIIATADTTYAQLKVVTPTTFQLICMNNPAGGTLTDPATLDYMLLGCETYSEFGGY